MNLCVEFEARSALECDKYTEMSKKRRQLKSGLGDGVTGFDATWARKTGRPKTKLETGVRWKCGKK